MKYYTFDYYKDFKCTADKCKHSCCKYWTIGVDKKTLKKYKNDRSNFSEKLKRGIDFKNSCIIMNKEGRCPFLNGENLCEIIINRGEEYLCRVCRDHPRFRSFFGGRTETGLGLACEEACRIIIDGKDPIKLVPCDKKKERLTSFDKRVLSFREEVLSIVENRTLSPIERLNIIYEKYGFEVTDDFLIEYKNFLLHSDILNVSWRKRLFDLQMLSTDKSPDEIKFEKLLSYFLLRHLSSANNSYEIIPRLIFAVLLKII